MLFVEKCIFFLYLYSVKIRPKGNKEKKNYFLAVWDFERWNFFSQKKVSFLSRTLLNIISSLIVIENK